METLRRGVLWGSGTVARKNRKRRRGRLALPCLRTVCMTISLFILAGCGVQERFTVPGTPRPLSCDIFTEFRWKELRFGVDSPAVVASVVGSLWGVEQDQFRFSNLYGGDISLEWSDNHSGRDIGYSAVFGVERQLERVDVLWSPPATLAQVIDCLDAPQLYSADYGSGRHEAIFLSGSLVPGQRIFRPPIFLYACYASPSARTCATNRWLSRHGSTPTGADGLQHLCGR